MPSRLLAHLTYANVVATLALFIALGGSAVAAGVFDGKKLKNRSVSRAKIKKNTLTGTEVKEAKLKEVPKATTAKKAAVADMARTANQATNAYQATIATRARAVDGLVRSNQIGAGRAASRAQAPGTGGLQKLSVGDNLPVLQHGPFTLAARCSNTPTGDRQIELTIASSEAGAWTSGGGQLTTNVPEPFFNYTNAGPGYQGGFGLSSVAAPSGASLHISPSVVGVNIFGADCVTNMYGVG